MAALGHSIVVIVRHDRLIDISPCSDINRRVFIRISCMTTRYTQKTGLGFAIGFFRMPASRALARGIAWINILNLNAIQLRLVFNKRLKLKERPTAVFRSVGFPNRCPFADMPEILQCNSASGVFGFLDKLFGNNVVLISPEPSFVAPDSLQVATGGTRSTGLQVFPQGMVATPGIFDRFARERFAIRITGNLNDPQVNANKSLGVYRRRGRGFDDHQKIEHAIHPHQIGLSMPAPKLHSLVIPHLHSNGQSTLQGQDTGGFQSLETQNPLIVDDCAGWLEKALFRLVALVRFNHFGNRPNGQLRRQTKLFPNVGIHQFLQNKLGRTLLPKRHFRNVVTRRVKHAHRVFQCRVLGFIREQFDLQYDLHIDDYIHKGI